MENTGARGALTRYRVMAFVTGVWLLLLCVELVVKYGLGRPWLNFVPFVHGWIYVAYVATVFQLWSVMRWKLRRFVTMALAGVIPVMSFVLERRVTADARASIEAPTGDA